MNKKIKEFVTNLRDAVEYRLRRLCGRPAPIKRFFMVLIIGGTLAIANIYLTVRSIYNIGKRDAQREFMKLQQKQDSMYILKQEEYDR